MLETNSGLRGSDGSFSGKAQVTSSNSTLDFKIDNDRMGRAVDCSSIKGVCGLKDSVLAAYGLLGREIEVEMCYWLIDGDSEMVGKGAPVEIATDTDYKIFKAAEVGGSKDSRAAADGVCGVNLEAENIRQQSCGEQILVQRGKNKQANVEAASGDDIGNVAGCAVMDVDKRKGNDYDIGEDEDEDDDYDYNYWYEFVRKDCDTDEDDDFEGCPPKGRRGGRSDRNGYERPGWRGGRGQGYGKPASGRGQQSRATGGSSSSKNRSNMRRYLELTDDQRDFYVPLESLTLRTPKKLISA
ncbi:hypothetical protein Bca52824_039339 [Brassica carinata]|uniref:Uncharacterized protein n=1 Tax=Brassica carinata TaxID=52824 RepID=A0A8X7RQY4_BRACI|nr:hypothetical protein Bca52824_039339 [Brassica carinata]